MRDSRSTDIKRILEETREGVTQKMLMNITRRKQSRSDGAELYAFFGTLLDARCKQAAGTQQKYRRKEKAEGIRNEKKNENKNQEHIEKGKSRTAALSIKQNMPPEFVEDLVHALRENRMVIVKGGTGAGKSTGVPLILSRYFGHSGLIGCTQPRRVAAVALGERGRKKEKKKPLVGYKVRFGDKKGSRIKYMTEGVLLNEIQRDPWMCEYSVVVIDEVHEKTVYARILIKHILWLLKRREDVRCVVMSAEIDEEVVRDVGPVPIVSLRSPRYPVEINYVDASEYPDYLACIAETIRSIMKAAATKRSGRVTDKMLHDAKTHDRVPNGVILVFLTGLEDISICRQMLIRSGLSPHEVCVLHSMLSLEQQMAAVQSQRKTCILATNIAETSITIPNVSHVIDSGMYKEMVYVPEKNTYVMQTFPIQRPQAEQRAGRTGRTNAGICIRLYTEQEYMSLHKSTRSKILSDHPETYIIPSIRLGQGLEPLSRISHVVDTLGDLGVISKNLKLTDLGREVSSLPLSVRHAIFLTLCRENGQSWAGICMVAMLEVFADTHFHLIRAQAEEDSETRGAHSPLDSTSDHMALLQVYIRYKKKGPLITASAKKRKIRREEARTEHHPTRPHLHPKISALIRDRVEHVVEQLCSMTHTRNQIAEYSRETLFRCLQKSHGHSKAQRVSEEYVDIRTKTICRISKSSLLSLNGFFPDFIIYDRLLSTGSTQALIVTETTSS